MIEEQWWRSPSIRSESSFSQTIANGLLNDPFTSFVIHPFLGSWEWQGRIFDCIFVEKNADWARENGIHASPLAHRGCHRIRQALCSDPWPARTGSGESRSRNHRSIFSVSKPILLLPFSVYLVNTNRLQPSLQSSISRWCRAGKSPCLCYFHRWFHRSDVEDSSDHQSASTDPAGYLPK